MDNDFFNKDGRHPEKRYDPAGIDERTLSLEPDRHEDPPREGTRHAAKLASLSILFSLVFVIGSLAFIVNNRQQVQTRASVDNLYGPSTISEQDKELTASVIDYPKRYKGRPIPENLVEEGNKKYLAIGEEERKDYIINRIVLYYIYTDVLSTNNIAFTRAPSPVTFEGIEQNLPELSQIMKREYPQPEVFVQAYLERFEY